MPAQHGKPDSLYEDTEKSGKHEGGVRDLDFTRDMCHADPLIWREKPWF
jgi:hypothetical protein